MSGPPGSAPVAPSLSEEPQAGSSERRQKIRRCRSCYRTPPPWFSLIGMALRTANIDRLDGGSVDVLIVGGGINGAVSAASLASRGASVALIDRGDFGGFTSQESSNLVWGGFKYLENYELRLVRKLCMSRNRLIRAYPANVAPIGFLATLDKTAPFSPGLAALGSLGYWGIGNFRTPAPRYLSPQRIKADEPIINTSTARGGIEYWDAILKDNDARFVFGFVRSALDSGAIAANYVELVSASRSGGRWHSVLRDVESGAEITCTSKVIINAAGPFIDGLNTGIGIRTKHRIVYSKGIHLVVPQLTPNDRVLAFFDDTKRLFYVIPMGRRSVIGTTDTRVDEPQSAVTDEDRNFLLDQINARLTMTQPLTPADVISERCGVRPLVVQTDGNDHKETDWTSLSRKHEIETDIDRSVVSIFGGKLTDCLNVGEEIAVEVGRLGVRLSTDRHDWYGEPDEASRAEFFRQATLMHIDELRERPDVERLSNRLWRRYGRRAFTMLEAIREDPSMGADVMDSADYLRVELHHAAHTEMITRTEDFLRRRSKISLVVPERDWKNSPGLKEVEQILFGQPSAH